MKTINAVKMVRDIRDKQFEETKNKTNEELIRYVKEKAKWAYVGTGKQRMTSIK